MHRPIVAGSVRTPRHPQAGQAMTLSTYAAWVRQADERTGNGSWAAAADPERELRSEEHTSELQSLMRISYAVFCLKKKNKHTIYIPSQHLHPISLPYRPTSNCRYHLYT